MSGITGSGRGGRLCHQQDKSLVDKVMRGVLGARNFSQTEKFEKQTIK